MTAPALNPAQFLPTAPTGAGVAAASPSGAAGAFEVLMSALFPPASATAAAAQAPAPLVVKEGGLLADEGATDETEVAAPTTDGEAAVDADAAALAASLAGAQTAQPPAPPTTAGEAAGSPPAWGQNKAKGAPAQPALLHANPQAGLADKTATAETSDAAQAAPDTDTPPANTPALPAQASDAARVAVQQAPAQRPATPAPAQPPAPAPAPAPAPGADAADTPPPAQTASMSETETPTAPAAAPATASASEVSVLAAGAARPEAAAQANQRPRSEKAENEKKIGAEDAKDARPGDAPAKAAVTKPADAALKTAYAKPEAIEPKAADGRATSDAPDAAQPLEARAAGQSSAAGAQAPQPVRGSPETVAALAAQIVKKLDGKSTRFDVELDPAGLGKVDVRVEIGAHGRMVASLSFENPQAAQDLKARSGDLQRALEQAGFDLSGGLSFDVAGERGRHGQPRQEQAGDNSVFHGRAFRQALDTAGEADAAANQGALRLRRGVSAGLDMRI